MTAKIRSRLTVYFILSMGLLLSPPTRWRISLSFFRRFLVVFLALLSHPHIYHSLRLKVPSLSAGLPLLFPFLSQDRSWLHNTTPLSLNPRTVIKTSLRNSITRELLIAITTYMHFVGAVFIDKTRCLRFLCCCNINGRIIIELRPVSSPVLLLKNYYMLSSLRQLVMDT